MHQANQVDQEIMAAMVRVNWSFISKMLMRVFTVPQLLNAKTSASAYDDQEDAVSFLEQLPADVKEGYFVVHATNGGDPERFIIELGYLSHPGFMKLLKLAEEEFGFKQVGVLTVPCWSIEIQKILEN